MNEDDLNGKIYFPRPPVVFVATILVASTPLIETAQVVSDKAIKMHCTFIIPWLVQYIENLYKELSTAEFDFMFEKFQLKTEHYNMKDLIRLTRKLSTTGVYLITVANV